MTYPQKHVLVCEDDLTQQKRIAEHFSSVFDTQGIVQFSFVPGAVAAASIISSCKIDLVILDHDMPEGNGADLIAWMKENKKDIPIITFSGIAQNNANMMAAGATHLAGKEEVIRGQVDDLIKTILGLKQANVGIAETYVNTVCINTPTATRYWVMPNIMVGGSVTSKEDWEHLQKAYNMGAVINVETEHSDVGKGIDKLLEIQVPDNGTPFPFDVVKKAVLFSKNNMDKNIYVHCQMGASRSPAFAYAVLRYCYNMTPQQALEKINESYPSHNYGYHGYHQTYIGSIEQALAELI
jgi:CheY-like chemotaxis protein